MLLYRRKNVVLWIWLVVTLLVSMFTLSVPPILATTALLSAPVVLDVSLAPSSTFHIDISIANVENLWGYSFILYYNTTILNATSESSYEPFTQKLFTDINEAAGYVYMAYSMPMGTEIGFSTPEMASMARIDFTVNALGTSSLNLNNTKLSDPMGLQGEPIYHDVFDGFFANVEIPDHDLAVTDVVAPTTVAINATATVTVTVENQGNYSETFNVTLYYDRTLIETKMSVTLSVGASTTLTFSWDTTGVPSGTYEMKAVASVVPGEVEIMNNTFIDGEITIGEGGEEQAPDYTLYIVAGIVIVIVVAITLVYLLRIRKTKET